MAERPIQELDDAIEHVMNDREPPADIDPRLGALLEIAGGLRGLPSDSFKQRLAAELAAAASRYGGPLRSGDEIRARLAELDQAPALVPFDLGEALRDLPDGAMRFLAKLDRSTVIVSRSSNVTHWERHGADEILHFLDGEADVVTLTGGGSVRTAVRAGDVFICPRDLWHRIEPRSTISLLSATPSGTRVSDADDPRAGMDPASESSGDEPPALEARNVRAVLGGLPELRIGAGTTAADADAAFGLLARLDRCDVHVGRFYGQSPWERHANGDELLHVLEGEVDLTVLTDTGPVHRTLRAGSIFVCPRGLWHRQLARDGVTGIFATPKPTDVSFADDPRLDA
jgi:quercetin dioxygenase-like cupin family protein